MNELFMNVCMDLWAGDCAISYDLFVKTVKSYIENLKSIVGPEAHKRLLEKGVVDETGMTWEEQDRQVEKQIKGYEELLEYLGKDSNWTP